MLPENQKKAFDEFYNLAGNSEILESKTTGMIQLAVVMAVGCIP
jgi:hypothetical protein